MHLRHSFAREPTKSSSRGFGRNFLRLPSFPPASRVATFDVPKPSYDRYLQTAAIGRTRPICPENSPLNPGKSFATSRSLNRYRSIGRSLPITLRRPCGDRLRERTRRFAPSLGRLATAAHELIITFSIDTSRYMQTAPLEERNRSARKLFPELGQIFRDFSISRSLLQLFSTPCSTAVDSQHWHESPTNHFEVSVRSFHRHCGRLRSNFRHALNEQAKPQSAVNAR